MEACSYCCWLKLNSFALQVSRVREYDAGAENAAGSTQDSSKTVQDINEMIGGGNRNEGQYMTMG